MRLVLVGKAKTGRSMCSLYLYRRYKFKEMGLEDGAKEIIRKFYYLGDHRKIKWEMRVKVYDALYKIDPNIFIHHLERRLNQTIYKKDIVIDDVRYMNELSRLRELGFKVIRIVSPEKRRQSYIRTAGSIAKDSVLLHEWYNTDKTGDLAADYVIYNNDRQGTFRALDKIVEILREQENLTNSNRTDILEESR